MAPEHQPACKAGGLGTGSGQGRTANGSPGDPQRRRWPLPASPPPSSSPARLHDGLSKRIRSPGSEDSGCETDSRHLTAAGWSGVSRNARAAPAAVCGQLGDGRTFAESRCRPPIPPLPPDSSGLARPRPAHRRLGQAAQSALPRSVGQGRRAGRVDPLPGLTTGAWTTLRVAHTTSGPDGHRQRNAYQRNAQGNGPLASARVTHSNALFEAGYQQPTP